MTEEQKSSIKYVKVCDRNGYCVMKIKPNEKDDTDVVQIQRKKKKLTRKMFLKKEDTNIKQVSDVVNRRPIQNPFISKTINKNKGKITGMDYSKITLTTDGREGDNQSE